MTDRVKAVDLKLATEYFEEAVVISSCNKQCASIETIIADLEATRDERDELIAMLNIDLRKKVVEARDAALKTPHDGVYTVPQERINTLNEVLSWIDGVES